MRLATTPAQRSYPVVQRALWRRDGLRPANIDTGAVLVGAANVAWVLALNEEG